MHRTAAQAKQVSESLPASAEKLKSVRHGKQGAHEEPRILPLPYPAAADGVTQASDPAGAAAAPRAAWASWSAAARDLLLRAVRLPLPGLSDVHYVESGRARVLYAQSARASGLYTLFIGYKQARVDALMREPTSRAAMHQDAHAARGIAAIGLDMGWRVTVRESKTQQTPPPSRSATTSALCCPRCEAEHATVGIRGLSCRTSADSPCVWQGARRSRLLRAGLP